MTRNLSPERQAVRLQRYRAITACTLIQRYGELPACFVRKCEEAAVSADCELAGDTIYGYWRLVASESEAA